MALNSDGVILLAPGMLCMLTQCSLSCRKSRASGHRRSHSPHRQLTASGCQFQHSLGRTCGCLPRRTMPLSASFSRPRLFTCSSQAEDAPAGRRARTPAAAALEFEVWPEITWAGTSSLAPVQRADDVAPPCPDCRERFHLRRGLLMMITQRKAKSTALSSLAKRCSFAVNLLHDLCEPTVKIPGNSWGYPGIFLGTGTQE